MKCLDLAHKNQDLRFICLDQQCQLNDQFCQQCVYQYHFQHQNMCIEFNQLNQYVYLQILEPYKKLLLQYLDSLKQTITQSVQEIQQRLQSNQTQIIQNKKLINGLTHFIQQKLQKFTDLYMEMNEQSQQIEQQFNNQQLFQEQKNQVNKINSLNQQQEVKDLGIVLRRKPEEKIQNLYSDSHQQIQQEQSIVQLQQREANQQLQQDQKMYYKSENQIEQSKILKGKQKLSNKINLFFESLKRLQKQNEQFIQQTNQNKLLQNPNSLTRLSNLYPDQLKFFPNDKGTNVFAKNGNVVYYDDISGGSEIHKDFKQAIILLTNFCPKKIQQFFINPEINQQQYYCVKTYKRLSYKCQLIELDDYVQKNQEFLIGANNSIWITLLQKVIDEFREKQENLVSTMKLLFPSPYFLIKTSEENLLQIVENELKENSFMITFMNQNPNQKDIFQILGCQLVKNPFFGDDTMLLKMKSPISKHIYCGDWGFQSPYWTPEIINQLQVEDFDDGIFYIDFVSFIKDFDSLLSYRINQKPVWKEKCIYKVNQGNYFQITVNHEAEYIFQYSEETQNTISDKSHLHFLIGQQIQNEKEPNNSRFKFIASCNGHFSNSLKINLKPGIYIIYSKVQFLDKNSKLAKGQLIIFSSKNIEFSQIPKLIDFKHKVQLNFLQQQSKKIFENNQFSLRFQVNSYGLIIQVINLLQNSFKLNIEFPVFQSLKLCKPYKGQKVETNVLKGETFLLYAKIIDCNYKFQATFFINDKFIA